MYAENYITAEARPATATERATYVAVLLLLIAALVYVTAYRAPTTSTRTVVYPLCHGAEDHPTPVPCYWDAETNGNGTGVDFVYHGHDAPSPGHNEPHDHRTYPEVPQP